MGRLTPLLYAAREGFADAAIALLDAGADVNQVSAGDHTSPLLMAAINGNFDLALALLQRGANPNLAATTARRPSSRSSNTYWVAQVAAIRSKHADVLQKATYLETMEAAEGGANPNARLERHPWYRSTRSRSVTIDTKGATPFWRAAYATDVDANAARW
jgi:ankyrin repeat protein